MGRLSRLFILIAVSLLWKNSFSGKEVIVPFPFGTIGCLVADVCQTGEICTDDLLFGSCQNILQGDLIGQNKFELLATEIKKLEDEIHRLIQAGFTWKDAFTQCVLQNSLLEFRHGRTFNRQLCVGALGADSEDADLPDALQLLETLQGSSTQVRGTRSDFDPLNSHKRDEIVQVHKYFDKSAGQLKRGLDVQNFAGDVRPIDNNQDVIPNQDSANNDSPSLDIEENLSDASNPVNTLLQSSEASRQGKSASDALQNVKNAQNPEDTTNVKSIVESLALTSKDEEALEKLLEGAISPSDLDIGQQKRLQLFVKGLIQVLEVGAKKIKISDPPAIASQPSGASPYGGLNRPGKTVNTDETDHIISTAVYPDETDNIVSTAVNPDLPLNGGKAGEEKLVKQSFFKSVVPNEKDKSKYEDSKMKQRSKEPRFVDGHFVYLQLSKEVSTEEAELFVQNLTEILNLPLGTVKLHEAGPGRMISLRVRTDLQGDWDAEKIAKQARSSNQQLKKITGITVEGAGVGRDGNRVEVKQDDSHVALAFILVGTIAGMVLAVVTLFLIRRNSRSRRKLALITGNPDSQESCKDYQDLCRQRMQSKSTEKPEPFHAVARVGSTSESQVRSPSSRSSTSSWSEEPAPGNMDILTGHIVLSYMEDHLKNQDRLDLEWEAISSYIPDPSSTMVGNDQSNMRKNRFSDILPYDHSRVILSTNANVSASDYINASFITDHDPRNPAYICTQGPLPHTVADFWQMIWEQGSVVIVMLTKLIENSACFSHRYWPEEGSDLYHVYEVHLVSEHIWCDDYLVRSFYLKNLQTGETRTVTQFHFLAWPELSVPASIKALLDFRRKVNKSFRGRSCPIVVHCSDGCSRSGTYCLIDMVLNKMAKGAKEIDMAATLEHIRDQRMSMVKTKEQFQFSLAAVAEEVHAILKALPQ